MGARGWRSEYKGRFDNKWTDGAAGMNGWMGGWVGGWMGGGMDSRTMNGRANEYTKSSMKLWQMMMMTLCTMANDDDDSVHYGR